MPILYHYKREVAEIDAFFDGLFSPVWLEDYSEEQDALLKFFEKDRTEINLKPYIRMLRVGDDCLHFFKPMKAVGKKIYACLKDEPIMSDVTDDTTIQTYWSKQNYGVSADESWKPVLELLASVKKDYKNK